MFHSVTSDNLQVTNVDTQTEEVDPFAELMGEPARTAYSDYLSDPKNQRQLKNFLIG